MYIFKQEDHFTLYEFDIKELNFKFKDEIWGSATSTAIITTFHIDQIIVRSKLNKICIKKEVRTVEIECGYTFSKMVAIDACLTSPQLSK